MLTRFGGSSESDEGGGLMLQEDGSWKQLEVPGLLLSSHGVRAGISIRPLQIISFHVDDLHLEAQRASERGRSKSDACLGRLIQGNVFLLQLFPHVSSVHFDAREQFLQPFE